MVQSQLLAPEDHVFHFDPPGRNFALSPDGSRLAFVVHGRDGSWELWVRNLSATSARALAGTDGAGLPFWSPDGRWIGFFARQKLLKISSDGGTPVEICETGPSPTGGTWGVKDVIVFASHITGPLYQVSASGGAPVAATTLDSAHNEVNHRWPVFLPDGHHFLFNEATSFLSADSNVYLGDLDSAGRTPVLQNAAGAAHIPGFLLYQRLGTLMAVAFDDRAVKLTGSPHAVAEQVTSYSAAGSTIVYAGPIKGELAWLDRAGREIEVLPMRGDFVLPKLSHDERRLAASNYMPDNRGDIWVYDLAHQVGVPLTFGPDDDYLPIWSPDDTRIVYSSNRHGHRGIYQTSANGGGSEELLFSSDVDNDATSWSLDGRFLLFNTGGLRGNQRIGQDLLTLTLPEKTATLFLKTQFRAHDGQFSPDRRWVAYASDDTGQHEIYVQPFPPNGSRWRISPGGGLRPKWRKDMKELTYIATDTRKMVAVDITLGSTFSSGTPHPLFDASMIRNFYNFDAAADSQRFIVVRDAKTETNTPLTLLQNWIAALKP
jgi:eukaryotic-like serine/threonine-protein kinase